MNPPDLPADPPDLAPTPSRTLLYGSAGLAALLLIGMAGLTLYATSHLPADAQIPTHWGPSGAPDAWGSPRSLWIMPGVSLFTAILLFIVPRFEPRRSHLLRSSRSYALTGLGILGFLAGMHVVMVLIALGHPVDMLKFVTFGMGLLFLVIGACMGNIQSNYIYGIRNKWTLSSERAWQKTHALGSKLFMLFGLALFGAGFTSNPGNTMIALMLIGIPILLLATFIYSHRVWKNDPERT